MLPLKDIRLLHFVKVGNLWEMAQLCRTCMYEGQGITSENFRLEFGKLAALAYIRSARWYTTTDNRKGSQRVLSQGEACWKFHLKKGGNHD